MGHSSAPWVWLCLRHWGLGCHRLQLCDNGSSGPPPSVTRLLPLFFDSGW